jgi:hypothetical protein
MCGKVVRGQSYLRRGGGRKDISEAARMKTLAQRPATHLSFGLGMLKWKTSRAMVPKVLSFARMDVWLFERAGNAGDLSGKEFFKRRNQARVESEEID